MRVTRKETKRAVFLDRDGTINHDAGYTHKVEELQLLDNAAEGLRLLAEMGFRLIVITNQAGIGRGYFTEQQMHAFHRRLADVLATHSVVIDAFYYCPCHPTAGVGAFRCDSPFRKPQPGMILQAGKEHGIDLKGSYAIGDKKSDVLAGRAAGCKTVLVMTGIAGTIGEAEEREAAPDYVARDLLNAAQIIQRAERLSPKGESG